MDDRIATRSTLKKNRKSRERYARAALERTETEFDFKQITSEDMFVWAMLERSWRLLHKE